MLQFDPTKRVEVQDALPLPFFKLGSEEVEKVLQQDMRLNKVDWSFDDFEPTRALLQRYIYLECARFHPEFHALLENDCGVLCERLPVAPAAEAAEAGPSPGSSPAPDAS